MRPKPPPAVRVSGGRNTRFADAGCESARRALTTQSYRKRSAREWPLWNDLQTVESITTKLSSGGCCWTYDPGKAVAPPPSAAAPGSASNA